MNPGISFDSSFTSGISMSNGGLESSVGLSVIFSPSRDTVACLAFAINSPRTCTVEDERSRSVQELKKVRLIAGTAKPTTSFERLALIEGLGSNWL
jgi:hypothetical protein